MSELKHLSQVPWNVRWEKIGGKFLLEDKLVGVGFVLGEFEAMLLHNVEKCELLLAEKLRESGIKNPILFKDRPNKQVRIIP